MTGLEHGAGRMFLFIFAGNMDRSNNLSSSCCKEVALHGRSSWTTSFVSLRGLCILELSVLALGLLPACVTVASDSLARRFFLLTSELGLQLLEFDCDVRAPWREL